MKKALSNSSTPPPGAADIWIELKAQREMIVELQKTKMDRGNTETGNSYPDIDHIIRMQENA